jgi:hypothetical protein
MILFVICLILFMIYFISEIYHKRIFQIVNVFLLSFFLRFYLFSPLISSGFIFSTFYHTKFKPEVQLIYNISAILILISIIISRGLFNNYFIIFKTRRNSSNFFSKVFNFIFLYTGIYYISTGVTPPILSPLFGESTLKNRLLLTYEKASESIFFYGNTIIKDYLLQNASVIFIIQHIKKKKYLFYIIISFFFIVYIGRKSSVANYVLFLGLGLYNFKYINLKGLYKSFIIVLLALFLFFSIYGLSDLLYDVSVRALIVESSFSYFQYDLYFNKPEIGVNIFNFPGSEIIFNMEHYDLKKYSYEYVFPGRVEKNGTTNAQGYAPLFLIIAFGKLIGYFIYFIICLFTLTYLRILNRSIKFNINNPYYFALYFLTISLSMNYFGVNIFTIFDFTIINFKYFIFLVFLHLFTTIKFKKNVLNK